MGLDPAFVVQKTLNFASVRENDEDATFTKADVQAYLVLPSSRMPETPRDECLSPRSQSISNIHELFRRTVRVLRLDGPHIVVDNRNQARNVEWYERYIVNRGYKNMQGIGYVARERYICVDCDAAVCVNPGPCVTLPKLRPLDLVDTVEYMDD